MEFILLTVSTAVLLLLAIKASREWRKHRRHQSIQSYQFPTSLADAVVKTYPQLTAEQALYVVEGLREYFHVCNEAKDRMVSMPSQAVDVVWHEFILFTRKYDEFCHFALGRFLHHTPAEAMPSKKAATNGLKTAWRISCDRESIDTKNPHKLPLLFTIDKELSIANGFSYSLDCGKEGKNDHCASHIGCSSDCAGSSGSADSGIGSGDSGCGGGCGGGD